MGNIMNEVQPIQKVAIVGGGMGGLTLARLIQQKAPEVQVYVYERDDDQTSRTQGYLLGVDDSGVSVLQNIIPNVHDLGCPESSTAFNLVGRELNMWAPLPFPGTAVCRTKLRSALCEGVNIQWGKRFKSYEETPQGVEIVFEDGSRSECVDLLVGCDGCRSRVRKQRCDKLKYDPIGITSVMGSVQIHSDEIPSISNLIQKGMTR